MIHLLQRDTCKLLQVVGINHYVDNLAGPNA